MLAGVGKEKLDFPEELFPIENYAGVHDDVYVRVMLLRGQTDFALVNFEMTSMRPYAIEALKSEASRITGIPKDQIWISVSHTFSVPHLRSEEALARGGKELTEKNDLLYRVLSGAMEKALKTAAADTGEAAFGFANAVCAVNVNRDVETPDGWWLGANDSLESDKTVPLIRIDGSDGKAKGILYSYDVQSSVMDHHKDADGYARITGDLAGSASRHIEEQFGEDFVALFLIGGAGDQAPAAAAGPADYQTADDLGSRLASCVVQAAGEVSCEPLEEGIRVRSEKVSCAGQKIAGKPDEIHPTKSYQYEPDEAHEVAVSLVTFGKAALIGLGPELSSSTASSIRKQSPYPATMVATLVNGADKYMPEEDAYDRITYEAMNSKFARGSAEKIRQSVIKELNQTAEGRKEPLK